MHIPSLKRPNLMLVGNCVLGGLKRRMFNDAPSRFEHGCAAQEEGKQIIGYTANEMQELKEAESPLFEARLNDVKCRSYLFKLKVSEDTWQDEQRIRINVVRWGPLSHAHSMSSRAAAVLKLAKILRANQVIGNLTDAIVSKIKETEKQPAFQYVTRRLLHIGGSAMRNG